MTQIVGEYAPNFRMDDLSKMCQISIEVFRLEPENRQDKIESTSPGTRAL
eukprot:CAMPEP_0185576298 /NCGR_PEP_ID=MMETSP0434-20130131/7262_1 /TAXON_ID=626734 ORGANISM="Favella taraikaensis, Strain Fe Narragansett Bay" /NCGR_SAMPLE_ID=MMETSP0434 /ASSEMBLY_ACC=CAM_ASM_000379 /LENGTH=49 /DNA_ID=CAMNT_0028193447 /DNA_START=11 /DNA_END=160 /DNA_ORIENTATION=-